MRWLVYEKVAGPEHAYTATSLNNLASLLKDQGDLAGARQLYQRALAIREKALGPEHPHTANSLNNLATLLESAGRSCWVTPAQGARAGDLREGARPRASRYRNGPRQSRPTCFGLKVTLAGARPLFERALAGLRKGKQAPSILIRPG